MIDFAIKTDKNRDTLIMGNKIFATWNIRQQTMTMRYKGKVEIIHGVEIAYALTIILEKVQQLTKEDEQ